MSPTYKHLAAWDQMLGSLPYYHEFNQRFADETGAPPNAIFAVRDVRSGELDHWVTYDEVTSAMTKKVIEEIFDTHGWGHPERTDRDDRSA